MGGTESKEEWQEEEKVLKEDPTYNSMAEFPFEQKLKLALSEADQKVSWSSVPEHPLDQNLIADTTEETLIQRVENLPRINVDSLLLGERDEKKLTEIGKEFIDQLQRNGVVLLKLSPQYKQIVGDFYDQAKLFFEREIDDKSKFSPARLHGERESFSGYSTIIFDNRDSIRDPEVRDVFQMRLFEAKKIPWPTSEFEKAAFSLYQAQWALSLGILRSLSLALSHEIDHFTKLISDASLSPSSSPPLPSPYPFSEAFSPFCSQNTNLCAFHYWDHFGYKTQQRCMVHQDNGFITLLPPPTAPGLHLLDRSAKSEEESFWIPLEELIKDDEMLFYCGRALEFVTGGVVPASVHRVVRNPNAVRYSCPFELKPFDDAVLVNPAAKTKEEESVSGKEFYVNCDWERVERKVKRKHAKDEEKVKRLQEKVEEMNSSLDQSVLLEGRDYMTTSVDVEA